MSGGGSFNFGRSGGARIGCALSPWQPLCDADLVYARELVDLAGGRV
jgi:hypothetical protein